MGRFNNLVATATANTAVETTAAVENRNEQTTSAAAPVPQPQPAQPTAQAQQTQKFCAAVAVQRIKEAIAAGAIQCEKFTDEDGHKFGRFFAPTAAGMKPYCYNFTYLNAVWDRKEWTATLPLAVLANPEAAEAAHQQRAMKVEERKAARTSAATDKATTTAAAAAKPTEPAAAGRQFTESQVRKMLRLANVTLSDEAISLIIGAA